MMFNNMPVLESLWMTEPKEMKVSLPCGGGWTKHVLRTVQVPRRDAIIMAGQILIHPAMMPELRRMLNEVSEG